MKRLRYVGMFFWLLLTCTACAGKENSEQMMQTLPGTYDLRDERELNPVDDQGTYGTCWAFAATAALEMSPMIEEGTQFSVDHMTMNNGFYGSPSDGGDYSMAIAYLSAWEGPVSVREDPYGDGQTDNTLSAIKHLQEVQILKEKNLDAIKRWIMTYGGVESPIYMSISHAGDVSDDYCAETSAYAYFGNQKANHDVVIIGWDDTYSKENFSNKPNEDGAFICRNSWGTEFGEDGYFYVSYEDVVLASSAVAYTRIENPENYSRIYQTDMLGWVGTLGFGKDMAWFANVYETQSDEQLSAVSFYAVDDTTSYDIYVVKGYEAVENLSEGTHVASGTIENCGYYTVDFEERIPLSQGEAFAVIVKIQTAGSERPIAIEYAASQLTKDVVLEDGRGFISHDGLLWASSEAEYGCNVCLKAFTD